MNSWNEEVVYNLDKLKNLSAEKLLAIIKCYNEYIISQNEELEEYGEDREQLRFDEFCSEEFQNCLISKFRIQF